MMRLVALSYILELEQRSMHIYMDVLAYTRTLGT
jgi:hypothetical protein